MTEEKIFANLLSNHYDNPKLHSEAAKTISSGLTDIIYDTLKLKSSVPQTKRLNVLKFLQSLTSNSEFHISVNQRNYLSFIESFRGQLYGASNEFADFLHRNDAELHAQLPENLRVEIEMFYRMKNERRRGKVKQFELVRKHDQEVLDQVNVGTKLARHISYYETTNDVIQNIFANSVTESPMAKLCDETNTEYRRKQINFAYALIYQKQWEILEQVVGALKRYKNLIDCEINFLLYLNEADAGDNDNLRMLLVEHFFFIYEKIILQLCTPLVQLVEVNEVTEFVETAVTSDTQFLALKKLCKADHLFKIKIESVLYELYSYSFCNSNLLVLIDLLK